MTESGQVHQQRPQVLWFYGADAVGKSTIGWEAYSILAERGVAVAYLDTDYLGFCSPAPSDPAAVVAENLRAVWAGYAARGIDHLVVSGIVVTVEDRERFVGAMPSAEVTFCRLTANPATVRRRILARREAEAATQGSSLSAATRAELEEYGQRSVAFAELLADRAIEDFALATDERPPRDIAADAVGQFLGGGSEQLR